MIVINKVDYNTKKNREIFAYISLISNKNLTVDNISIFEDLNID